MHAWNQARSLPPHKTRIIIKLRRQKLVMLQVASASRRKHWMLHSGANEHTLTPPCWSLITLPPFSPSNTQSREAHTFKQMPREPFLVERNVSVQPKPLCLASAAERAHTRAGVTKSWWAAWHGANHRHRHDLVPVAHASLAGVCLLRR